MRVRWGCVRARRYRRLGAFWAQLGSDFILRRARSIEKPGFMVHASGGSADEACAKAPHAALLQDVHSHARPESGKVSANWPAFPPC